MMLIASMFLAFAVVAPIDLGALADILDPPLDPYAHDPVGWIMQFVFLWSKQREICEAVRDRRYVAVRACHGSGKSFNAAWLIAWWLATHDDAQVVTTAPSAHQVKNILWKEIRRAHTLAKLPGFITQGEIPEWKVNGEVIAFGRKPADYVDPEKAATAFQGTHATNLLVVLDEAAGIPQWLANAVETLVISEQGRVLMIGNPTDPKSYFAKVQKPNGGYYAIKIDVWMMPWHTGEEVPEKVTENLTGQVWVSEREQRWKEKQPMLWDARVRAEFPTVTEDTLFTPAILNKGINTDRSGVAEATAKLGNQGMDVARMGSDETVVYHNKIGHVRLMGFWGKTDLEDTVMRFLDLWPHSRVSPNSVPTTQIDITGGLGAGPYDRLRHMNYKVVAFDAGKAALNPARYLNRRAEAYWEAMEAMDRGIIDIDELDEPLQEELLETKYKRTSTGLLYIEKKDEIAKRLGRSPDRADAFVMSLQESADWASALGLNQEESVRPDQPNEPREESAEDIVRDVMEVQL